MTSFATTQWKQKKVDDSQSRVVIKDGSTTASSVKKPRAKTWDSPGTSWSTDDVGVSQKYLRGPRANVVAASAESVDAQPLNARESVQTEASVDSCKTSSPSVEANGAP